MILKKNVISIKNKSGATKRTALILFLLSDFLRLTFKGIPSVVYIDPAVASFIISPTNKKGETYVSPFFKYYELLVTLPSTKSFRNFSAVISPPNWVGYNSSLKYFRSSWHVR